MWIFSCLQKPNLLPNSKRTRLSRESEVSDSDISSDFSDSINSPDSNNQNNTNNNTNDNDYHHNYYYRWCFTCETFHSLDWFYNPDFRCFDIQCFHRSQPRGELHVREVPQSSLPRDSRILLSHMRQLYHKDSRFFSRLVRSEMPGVSPARLNCCCLCQKPIDPPSDPKLDALPRSELGPQLKLGTCADCCGRWIQLRGFPIPLKFCACCRLFHPYLYSFPRLMSGSQFFDLQTNQFQALCTESLVNEAVLRGLLDGFLRTLRVSVGFPRVASPVPPSLEESKVVTTEKSLNRCRSPEAFHTRQKFVRGKCAHCGRLLLQEFEKEGKTGCERWICAFCRSHWFETSESKSYRFCEACKTFHWSL